MKRYIVNWLLLSVMAISAFLVNYALLGQPERHTDFYYTAWLPGQALVQGRNPYQAPEFLTYPLWALLLSLPLTWLPAPVALASWGLISECLAMGSITVTTKALGWPLSTGRFALLVLLAVTFRPSLATILLGQYLFVALFFIGMALLALHVQRYLLAGFFLAMTIVKPQLVFLVLPAVLAWTLVRRQWATLAGFLLTITGLITACEAILPSWIADWLPLAYEQQLPHRTVIRPSLWGLAHSLTPSHGVALASAVSLVVLAALAWVLWRYRGMEGYLPFMMSVTIIATQIVTPQVWSYDHVVLLLPFLYCVHRICRAGHTGSLSTRLWLAILLIWLIVLPYVLSVWAMAYHSEVPHALLPIILGILLLCIQGLKQYPETTKETAEPDELAL